MPSTQRTRRVTVPFLAVVWERTSRSRRAPTSDSDAWKSSSRSASATVSGSAGRRWAMSKSKVPGRIAERLRSITGGKTVKRYMGILIDSLNSRV
jgi:hypothetical protein